MSRYLLIAFIALGLLLYLASKPEADGESPRPAGIAMQGLQQARMSELNLAFLSARMTASCGYSDSAGYSHSTATGAAQRLVQEMTVSMQPMPGERAVKSHVSYALDHPTKPWQVVVRAGEGELVLASYGPDLELPVESERIPCG